ncbi:MAG: acyl-CoA thioesterase [Ktedonobacterales bacterium]|nr:acyl-CoA thioesterase [Ktedonobacterales bacterium]
MSADQTRADQTRADQRKPTAARGGASARHADVASTALAAKVVADSRIVMSRSMQPPDANVWGNVHGGAIMRLVDEAGGAVAIRHSRRPCVTVAMDSMIFKQPVYIGDLLTIHACLTSVGHTSMEVEARIEAENLRTGEVRHAGTSYLVYVALDDQGRPTRVPPLDLRTAEEHARWRAAEERRARRPR